MAQAKDIPNLAEEVVNHLKQSEAAATTWINSLGNPNEVCEIYNKAVRDLYWLEKSAHSLVIIGRLGIDFCLQHNLKADAKTIAYNVAANAWPGWGDEGVVIDKNDTEAGYQASQLNLKLAIELNKPADKISAAHWLVSALELATGRYAEALTSINNSIKYAEEANDKTVMAYNMGFKALILLATADAGADKLFSTALNELNAIATDDAKGYVQQLETAKKIFIR